MRLIDADALLEATSNFCDDYKVHLTDQKVLVWIDHAPTIDAVPVVRCRECKHWKPTGSQAGSSFSDMEYIGGCEFKKYCIRESDFCSYGERKEGADND